MFNLKLYHYIEIRPWLQTIELNAETAILRRLVKEL